MAGAPETGGSGAVGGNPLNCTTVHYPFHYTPQPPTYPVPATSVLVTGDWVNWTSVGAPLTVGEDGTWRGTTDVPIGERQYKFIVDGMSKWLEDPDNPNTVPDGNNGRNSVLTLKCGVDYSAGGGAGMGAAGQTGL